MRQLITCVLVLMCATLSYADAVSIGAGAQPVSVEVTQSDFSRTIITYDISQFDREMIDINGTTYWDVSIKGESNLLLEGEPSLPRISRSLIIGNDDQIEVKVIDAEYVDFEGVSVVPSKGNLLRTVNPDDIPYSFGSVYESSEYYPQNLAEAGTPYILRDYRGAVITLYPFQVLPSNKSLRVYTSVTLEVTSLGAGGANPLMDNSTKARTTEFKNVYSHHFLNYQQVQSREKYTALSDVSGDMLIITYDAFHAAMQPLVDWKNQKGIKTTIVDISTIGNTSSAIAGYIQNFYDTTNLAWVLLVGDYAQITSPSSYGGASDPSYTKLAGGDDYPEIFIGRFSAESVDDVNTQVTRTIDYELNPISGDWMHQGMGIASSGGPGHDGGEYDYEHMGYIRDDLLSYTYTLIDELYETTGASSSQVTSALNAGRSVINYVGHGSTTAWSTTGFNNSNVNALVNNDMLPFIISVACVNGEFDGPTCFGEAWLRATNNGEPSGAIGAYMSSINQSWNPPMDAQDECTDLLIADAMHTFGGLCFNGSMAMMDQNPGSDGIEIFDTWHIFGDPSVLLHTDVPTALSVTHDAVILFTATDFEVTVDGVEGALCAVYGDGILYGSALTDASGVATINFDQQLPVGALLTLTVTAYNSNTHVEDIQVITPDGPYLVLADEMLNDAVSGNGDGVYEAGETVHLGLQLDNVGPDPAYNVEVTISTLDSYVTLTDDIESFGLVDAESSVSLSDVFTFDVAPNVPDGHEVTFEVSMNGATKDIWNGSFKVTLQAPDIRMYQVSYDDPTGDNNGVLDPGETADCIVTLRNIGSASAYNVVATAVETDNYISLSADYGEFGTINSNGVGDNSVTAFVVTATGDCPVGYAAPVELQITTDMGYTVDLNMQITVGDRVTLFTDDFSVIGPWTGLGGDAEWAIGSPEGGSTDPVADHSVTTDNGVLGTDITSTGSYNNNIGVTDWVVSPIIDCGQMSGVQLSLWQWLQVESSTSDHAYIEAFNGTDWVTVWENPTYDLTDETWVERSYDLSAIADYNPTFQLRFGLGSTDGSTSYGGWNIDDLVLKGYGRVAYPDVSMGQDEMNDSCQADEQVEQFVTVTNNGEGTLGIRFTSNNGWLETAGDQIVILSGNSADIEFTVNTMGMVGGDYVGALEFVSNDPSHMTGNIPVNLHIYSPQMSIDDESIYRTMGVDEEVIYPLTIWNNGPGNLTYGINCQVALRSSTNVVIELPEAVGYRGCDDKNGGQEPFFAPVTRGYGGPDAFGHMWMDSDETGGPVLDWVDISQIGTEITSMSDDSYVGPLTIGFTFPMYDSAYTELYLSSNGVISFDVGESSLSNEQLPSTEVESSMIAMYWNDLDPPEAGHVYYYYDAASQRFIITFEEIRQYQYPSGTGSLTFQAILYPNGRIRLQYLTMDPGALTLDAATIGIQNSTLTDALQVVNNAEYLHDNMAIDIYADNWLTSADFGGMVAPYSSETVDIILNSTDKEAGQYFGTVYVVTNDPITPSKEIPVTMQVSLGCCIGNAGNVDCDQDDICDLSDLTKLIQHLFVDFEPLCCEAEANADGSDDGVIDLSDLTALIQYLFVTFEEPAACQ